MKLSTRPRLLFSTVSTMLLVTALASLVAVGCGRDSQTHSSPRGEEAEAPPVRARLGSAEVLELETSVELPGTVVAERTSQVSARVMATVTAVHVEAGDRVSRGDRLLDIDPQATGGQVTRARGALAQARSALTLAERNAERFRALLAEDAASQLEVDSAEMQLEQARGATLEAEGALAAAESLASDTRVVAPAHGRVVRRLVEVGDLAAPGRPLVELESEASRRLAVAVPEGLLARTGLAPGDTARVRLDARPELGTLEATVVEIVPAADPASHAFRVEVLLPEPEAAEGSTWNPPAVGAAGRLELRTATRSGVTAPLEAIVRHGGLELVVLRGADSRSETRTVTTGRVTEDGRVEVLSGLEGGEELLLGLGALPPAGSPVEVIEETR